VAKDQRNAELGLRIASTSDSTKSAAQKELAVVSPCSHCQNFTKAGDTSSDPYRTSCPRRIWIQQQANADPDNGQGPDPVLYLSGTTDPNKLANPVVDQNTGNYLVWIAAVEDNPGVVDDQGNVVTPGILDSKFDNTYIKCRLLPYVSEQHHDVLRTLGPFQEMDHVVAESHRIPPMTTPFTSTSVQYQETPVAGTVSKASFAYAFNTVNPDDHGIVGGT